MKYTKSTIIDLFTYHPPTPETSKKYASVGKALIELAYLVDELTEESEQKQNALLQLHVARMAINLAITSDAVVSAQAFDA